MMHPLAQLLQAFDRFGPFDLLAPRLEMADTTEINAFIIDLKADQGYIAYESQVPMAAVLK